MRPAVLLLAAVVLAACERTPDPARDAPEPAPAPQAAVPATPAAALSAPQPSATPAPGADAARAPTPGVSLIGEFAGGGVRLSVRSDGAFELAQGAERVEGTWAVEDDGRVLRLDPNSKAQADRVFDVVSADTLRARGEAGVLTRQPAE